MSTYPGDEVTPCALDVTPAVKHYQEALKLTDQGLYFAARRELTQAIRKDPNFAEAHFDLGANYRFLGQSRRAIREYRLALEIRPDFVDACRELASTYDQLGYFAGALRMYAKAILLNPADAELRNDLGILFHRNRRYAEAIMAHRQALTIDPESRRAYLSLGLIYTEVGDREFALKALERLKECGHLETASRLSQAIGSNRRWLEKD